MQLHCFYSGYAVLVITSRAKQKPTGLVIPFTLIATDFLQFQEHDASAGESELIKSLTSVTMPKQTGQDSCFQDNYYSRTTSHVNDKNHAP
jgi:hypothetical protein